MIVTCPECKQKLRLNAEVPAGKRIKCPKCAALFSPADEAEEAPPAREDSVSARRSPMPPRSARPEPDAGDDEDDPPKKSKPRGREEEEEDDAPRARSKAKRRDPDEDEDDDEDDRPARRRKRAKKGNAGLLWGLIGGGTGLVVLVSIVVVLVLRGGGGSAQQEEAIKEGIQIVREFRQVMEGVKDQNSARTAAAQINALSDRMDALGKRAKALPKVSKAEDNRLKEKYKPEMDQLQVGMQQVGMQAGMNSGGEPSFMAALMKFGQVAQRMQAEQK